MPVTRILCDECGRAAPIDRVGGYYVRTRQRRGFFVHVVTEDFNYCFDCYRDIDYDAYRDYVASPEHEERCERADRERARDRRRNRSP